MPEAGFLKFIRDMRDAALPRQFLYLGISEFPGGFARGQLPFLLNAFVSLIHLRDITLVRTEYEVGREIVGRLPRVERNISEFMAATKDKTRGPASSDIQVSTSKDSVNKSQGATVYETLIGQ